MLRWAVEENVQHNINNICNIIIQKIISYKTLLMMIWTNKI